MWLNFQVFSDKDFNRRPRLTILSMFKIPVWDIKEPTHHSEKVGREVSGIVAVLYVVSVNLRESSFVMEANKR